MKVNSGSTVLELLLDQIEFANVVILNNMDLVEEQEAKMLKALLRILNPEAIVIDAVNADVSLDKIFATSLFDFEKVSRSAGWLQLLQGAPHVAAEEHGISSFVFNARRPFHPTKLFSLMTKYFNLREPDDALDGNGCAGEPEIPTGSVRAVLEMLESVHSDLDAISPAASSSQHAESATRELLAAKESVLSAQKHLQSIISGNTASEESRDQKMADATENMKQRYGLVLRAKGFVWVASRSDLYGEWSQAGSILRFSPGGPWYASLPMEEWPSNQAEIEDIKGDFVEPFGDRRQELVFIGVGMDKEKILKDLESCLLTEKELSKKDFAKSLQDPFAAWPSLEKILGSEDENYGDNVDYDDANTGIEKYSAVNTATLLHPGVLVAVTDGAAQAQMFLDRMVPHATVIFHWYADWHAESTGIIENIEDSLKGKNAYLVHIDIAKYYPNWSFAMEKVMRPPEASRPGAKPILKNGAKWPCFSTHSVPQLHPLEIIAGKDAVKKVIARIKEASAIAPISSEEYTTSEALMETITQVTEVGELREKVDNLTIYNNSGTITSEDEKAMTENIVELTNGAIEMRTILKTASNEGKNVYIIWENGKRSRELAAVLSLLNEKKTEANIFYTADISSSKGNSALAKAFSIKTTPSLFMFKKMKLDSKVEGLHKVVSALKSKFGLGEGSATSKPGSASLTGTPGDSIYSPPEGKACRSGATKLTPDGKVVHFFPKMPCLRCGCPWWSSDQWDAKCIRCTWNCERGGYDDDSNPLPEHQARWAHFVGLIKSGVTPEWKGK